MRWLLDTSVYSQPLKKKPILTALKKWEELGDLDCVISSVCAAEVEWGLHYADKQSLWDRYHHLLEGRLEVPQRFPKDRIPLMGRLGSIKSIHLKEFL